MGNQDSFSIKKPLFDELGRLLTERSADQWPYLETLSTREILKFITTDYQLVLQELNNLDEPVSALIDSVVKTLESGSSVIYCGAGTSGRLGVLDASEIPPTFGVTQDLFRGIIAGGEKALRNSVEGAEDDVHQSITDYQLNSIRQTDLLIGITASSRTPYVLEMLKYHHSKGGTTGLLICNPKSENEYPYVHHFIPVNVGNEFVTGSTRMKSGTMTKIILNNISTISMLRMGKTFRNYMVDLRVVNEKLRIRAVRTISELTRLTPEESHQLLVEAGMHVKTALVMHFTGTDFDVASERIRQNPLILHELAKSY